MNDTSKDDSQLDILHGAEKIGAYLGIDRRRAFYLLQQNELPAKKLGGRWISTKTQLRKLVMGAE